ncbi:2-keto-4-pentenoate hydratase [Caballeronia sp. 15715]|uniref:2-keto-4-pentenoate hydratase n=1 Tax=unclassified Caballeronia TaxID=2646786 RepID=UPI0039E6A84A
MVDIGEVAEDFWNALQIGGIPEKWRTALTGEEGYRVQLAMQERHNSQGDTRIGWKVSATSAAVRRQLNLSEPGFGSIRQSKKYLSGHRLELAGLIGPHAESELCFELNANIADVKQLDDVRGAIARCFPAFEISEKRVPISDFGACMADNAEHTAIVLGEPIGDVFNIDFPDVVGSLEVDGKQIATAKGEVLGGSPLYSILWLKQRLAEYGQRLEPGMLVMSGSFVRQIPIKSGQTFKISFSKVGSASFTGV